MPMTTCQRQRMAERWLGRIAAAVTTRPRTIVAGYLVVATISAIAALTCLELKTDTNEMVSSDQKYAQLYQQFIEEFGDLEHLYVVVRADKDPVTAARAADRIAERLIALAPHVQGVFHRVPPEIFATDFLMLPQYRYDDIRDLAETIQQQQMALHHFGDVDEFADVFDTVSGMIASGRLQNDAAAMDRMLSLLDAIVQSITSCIGGQTPPPLVQQVEKVAGKGSHPRERGYLFSDNGNFLFIEILPEKNYESVEVIREPLAAIRAVLDEVRVEFPDTEFGLTGLPVLHADEMITTDTDTRRATALALVLVLGLFIFFFRRLLRPMIAAAALAAAIVITFGAATASIGYLTLLSIVFAAMLVGLGIDFGIHFLARYQDELITQADARAAVTHTMITTGVGIWTGGVTTAAAFYAIMLVDFQGLVELGFIAGTGVLICLITMLTLFPALLIILDGRRTGEIHLPAPVRAPYLDRILHYRGTTLWILLFLSVCGLAKWQGIQFNYNLLDLQAQGLESVRFQRVLVEASDRTTWYNNFIASDIDDARRIVEALEPYRNNGIIGGVETISNVIDPNQKAKAEALRGSAEIMGATRIKAGKAEIDAPVLNGSAKRLISALNTQAASTAGTALRDRIHTLTSTLETINAERMLRLGAYQQTWFRELKVLRDRMVHILSPRPIGVERLPPELKRRYVSETSGKILVYAYPARDIWDEDNMRDFINATRDVDADVTGTPIQIYESVMIMKHGFLHAAGYAVGIVFVFVLIDLRSLRETLLILVPLSAGLFWLIEIMPWLGLEFNMANFFALPILIGCGVDGGVHMMHRFRETRDPNDVIKTTGSAVCLSFLTTMAGFGSLATARHDGVASLGCVMAVGMCCILISTLILLPCIMAAAAPMRSPDLTSVET